MLRAPRFYGDDVLESCLTGHRIFQGSGDPPEVVAKIQQALADLQFSVVVDGIFGTETGSAVTAYKTARALTPNDPVVGPGTMAALDNDFAHELFDAKAQDLAGTHFDLGSRTGTRVDVEDGFATCEFENGTCMEVGHILAYAVPTDVVNAWKAAGELTGTFGLPASDPLEIDATRAVQEFTSVACVFGEPAVFTLPRPMWEASVAGQGLIGGPTGAPQVVGGGVTFVPHDRGVVLAVEESSPQPLPQAVFDLWSAQAAAGTSLGPPTGFAFPSSTTPDGIVFPFSFGSV